MNKKVTQLMLGVILGVVLTAAASSGMFDEAGQAALTWNSTIAQR